MENVKPFEKKSKKMSYKKNPIQDIASLFCLLEREITKVLKTFDLSVAKFNILMIVKHHGGSEGVSQTELKKKMVVTASNITKLIDKLYNEGLINRLDHETDRRVNRITITSKGSDLLDKVLPFYNKKVQELTNMLNYEELNVLNASITRWQHLILNQSE